jgi:hypothetical protein
VSLKFRFTVFGAAPPEVLVFDLVSVLGSDMDAAVAEGGGAESSPALKLGTMGPVFNPAYEKVGEVAELVGENVEEAWAVCDDFGGELDAGVVFCGCRRHFVGGRGSLGCVDCLGARFRASFSFPVGAAGSGSERLAPDQLDSSSLGRELGDFALCDFLIEFFEERLRKFLLDRIKVLLSLGGALQFVASWSRKVVILGWLGFSR